MGNEITDIHGGEDSAHLLYDGLRNSPLEHSERLGSEKTTELADAQEFSATIVINRNGIHFAERPDEVVAARENDFSIVAEIPCVNKYLVSIDAQNGKEIPCVNNFNIDRDVAEKKIVVYEAQKPANLKKSNSPTNLAPKSENLRPNHTVPQPFALSTDRRISGARPVASDATSKANIIASGNTNQSKAMQKKPERNSSLTSRKPLQQDNTLQLDQEDACSGSSSTAASGRASKAKTTVAHALTFRSLERAEKRKQFYSKLEEKHQAMEAEKTQCEARTKEECEAALKQLRKSLTFKANPMPSFYCEGPPPKIELKKVPPTRAKSPKLGRRKSCNDAVSPTVLENHGTGSGLSNRHSLGSQKADEIKTQGVDASKTTNIKKIVTPKSKGRIKPVKGYFKPVAHTDVVQGDPCTNALENETEQGKTTAEQESETEQSNGEAEVDHTETTQGAAEATEC